MRIRSNRTVGQGYKEDEILREEGFQTSDDYWRTALHNPMTADRFAYLLESHLLDPQRTANEILRNETTIKSLISQALKVAHASQEGLFVEKSAAFNGELMLRPLPTAEWLAKNPIFADRVPPSLQVFLGAKRDANHPRKKRSGPVSERITAALREIYPRGIPSEEIGKYAHNKILGWFELKKYGLPSTAQIKRIIKAHDPK